MRALEKIVIALFVERLGGEQTDGLGYGGLEKPAIFRVGGTVGGEGLTEGEEC